MLPLCYTAHRGEASESVEASDWKAQVSAMRHTSLQIYIRGCCRDTLSQQACNQKSKRLKEMNKLQSPIHGANCGDSFFAS